MDNSRYLFRGKRLDDREWVVGNLVIGEIGGCWILQIKMKSRKNRDGDLEISEKVYEYAIDGETVGQCTGLYAAKSYMGEGEEDRLIWEGDIANDEIGKGVIRYIDGAFGLHYLEPYDKDWLSTLLLVACGDDDICEVEIIGNIHDEQEAAQ